MPSTIVADHHICSSCVNYQHSAGNICVHKVASRMQMDEEKRRKDLLVNGIANVVVGLGWFVLKLLRVL